MSTRCITIFYEQITEQQSMHPVAALYRQFDGYLERHGYELAEFLKDKVLVNGYTPGDTRKLANGIGNLAVQTIAHFNEGHETFRMVPGGDRGEEFIYEVFPLVVPGFDTDGEIGINVYNVYGEFSTAYKCTPQFLYDSINDGSIEEGTLLE